MVPSIHVECLCRKNEFLLEGEPATNAYCHCQTCRDIYGGDLLAATAWLAEQISWIHRQSESFKHPDKNIARTFCTSCGETLFGINRLGMIVIPNALVARGKTLPLQLSPKVHLFYNQRIVDISDSLPKYEEGWDGSLWAPVEN